MVFVLTFAVMIASARAFAALGEPADSVAADRDALGGRMVEALHPRYTVERITTPAATVVSEYVAPSGVVFAVTWRGPAPANLSVLLGAYFHEYQEAAARAPLALHHSTVRTKNLIVETGGHMRALWGRAIIPALVPAGVDETEIR